MRLLLILMLGCCAQVWAQASAFRLGVSTYNRGDYETARQMFMIEAEAGMAAAQYNLGVMYANGEGVPQNFAEAVRWYRMAAVQGDADAQFNLGVMYENGRGVTRNDAEAARWYRMAAEQGDAQAQAVLGAMHAYGEGVPMNDVEAVRWYRMAAEQGDADAQYNLGAMYENGRGVTRNDAEAVRWYRMAAVQGGATAQSALAVLYAIGKGVSVNIVLAHMWASLAAAQGNEIARDILASIKGQMTRAQVAEAQRLAAAWQPGSSSTSPTAAPASDAPTATRATIRNIQRQLAMLGYDPGPADGLTGARTLNAIMAFQRGANIEPDGIPSTTLSALLRAVIEEQQTAAAPAPKGPAIAATGTGFFINPQGHLLTNQHIIQDCASLTVQMPDGQRSATLLAKDAANDLAVLAVDTTPPAIAPLRRTGGELGETVLVAGYPLRGLLSDINVTAGEISATTGARNDRRYLQISAPVQKGNSGGPLLDAAGAVVGVVVASLNAVSVARVTGGLPQNINFAIKGALARSFLSIYDIPFTAVDASPARAQTTVAAEARQHTVPVECWK